MKQLTIDNLRKASNAITGEHRLRVNEKKRSALIRQNAITRQAQLYSGVTEHLEDTMERKQTELEEYRDLHYDLIREADDNERW